MGIFNFFRRNKRSGLITKSKHFDDDGNLESLGAYVNGKKEGFWKYYAETNDGKLYVNLKQTYLKGLREGLSTEYHENGKIFREIYYKNDVGNGICRDYNENGILVESGIYVNGKENGEWKYYDNKGNLKIVVPFKDGEISDPKIKNIIMEESKKHEGLSQLFGISYSFVIRKMLKT